MSDIKDEGNGKVAAQVETIMESILNDHPHLRAAREAARRDEEPTHEFAHEFLSVFRKRLQG
jgi:hypothetical protein